MNRNTGMSANELKEAILSDCCPFPRCVLIGELGAIMGDETKDMAEREAAKNALLELLNPKKSDESCEICGSCDSCVTIAYYCLLSVTEGSSEVRDALKKFEADPANAGTIEASKDMIATAI